MINSCVFLTKILLLSIFLRKIFSPGLALVAVLIEIQFFHFSGQAPVLPSKSVSFVRVSGESVFAFGVK